MPKQLQIFYDRVSETKQEIKEIQAIVKDALANSGTYQQVEEELKNLKLKKKEIVRAIMDDFVSEENKLDQLKLDKENDRMLMSDIAVANLTKGVNSNVKDKNGVEYFPEFTVKFKKI